MTKHPSAFPSHLFHPVGSRAQLAGIGGSREVAEELAAAITAHWQPMVAVGRMQLLASSQQEAGNVSHLPGLQDHTAVPATFLLCWKQG